MAFMYLRGRGPIIFDDFCELQKTMLFVGLFSRRYGGGGGGSKGGADMLLGKGTGRRFSKER
jgi:hypothetical protein